MHIWLFFRVQKKTENLDKRNWMKSYWIAWQNWSNQQFIQRFYFEVVKEEEDINTFEWIEIAENIYEGVVETSHKKTRAQSNRDGYSSNMRVIVSS